MIVTRYAIVCTVAVSGLSTGYPAPVYPRTVLLMKEDDEPR
jgi:hypothetical protein